MVPVYPGRGDTGNLEKPLIHSQYHVIHCRSGAPCAPWINGLQSLSSAHGAPCNDSINKSEIPYYLCDYQRQRTINSKAKAPSVE
jgi:hypothetical protein